MMWGSSIDDALDNIASAGRPADRAPAPSIFEGDWWRQVGQIHAASEEEGLLTGYSYSRNRALADAYAPVIEELNRDRPFAQRFSNPYSLAQMNQYAAPEEQLGAAMAANAGVPSAGTEDGRKRLENEVWAALDQARLADPGRYANLPKSSGDLYEQTYARARDAVTRAQQLRQDAGGLQSTLGTLTGNLIPALQDPYNVLTAALGGGASSSYLQFMLSEGAAGAAGVSLAMPDRARWRREIGMPLTAGEAVGDVAGAAAGSAVLAAGGRLVARNIAGPAWRAGRDALFEMFTRDDVPPSMRAAANVLDQNMQRIEDNPFEPTLDGQAQHDAAFDAADRALNEGPPLADNASPPPSPAADFSDPAAKPESFDTQRQGLAAELGGEAMHQPLPEAAAGEAVPSPFGEQAAKELASFDAIDPEERVPAPERMASIDGTVSAGELRASLEGEAKAVERLRLCAIGEG